MIPETPLVKRQVLCVKKNCDWHIRIKFFEHIASEDKTERHEMYQPFGGHILCR